MRQAERILGKDEVSSSNLLGSSTGTRNPRKRQGLRGVLATNIQHFLWLHQQFQKFAISPPDIAFLRFCGSFYRCTHLPAYIELMNEIHQHRIIFNPLVRDGFCDSLVAFRLAFAYPILHADVNTPVPLSFG